MNWFTETFLPSIEKRMNNPKYPNQCILSEKQVEICYKYMKAIYHRSDYGGFYNYEIETDKANYMMTKRGRYTFLTKTEKA